MGETTASTRKLRAERKAAGLCTFCGHPATELLDRRTRKPTGKKSIYCQIHLDENNAYSRARQTTKRATWTAQGLCTECGQPRYRKYSVCRKHYKARKRRLKGWNETRQLEGKCFCGAPVEPEKDRCFDCLAIERDRINTSQRERRAAGLCIQCGRRAMWSKRKGKKHRKARCVRCTRLSAIYYQNRKRRGFTLRRTVARIIAKMPIRPPASKPPKTQPPASKRPFPEERRGQLVGRLFHLHAYSTAVPESTGKRSK